MKKKNSNKKEKITMDDNSEVRILAYCAECGDEITDDIKDYYCDDDGNFFCSDECAMIHHGIHRLEI